MKERKKGPTAEVVIEYIQIFYGIWGLENANKLNIMLNMMNAI